MTRIEQQNHSYWISAFAFGTILNILLFVLLPTLGHSEKQVEPMVIALDFVAWQEPIKPKKKAKIKPKPKKKLKKKEKPEKKVEIPKPKPKPIEEPVLTESIEPPKQEEPPPIEELIDEPHEEVLPEPVPIFQVTSLPRVVHWEKPEYPASMKVLGREATVKVEVLIDKFGKVRKAEVVKSGGVEFDNAAIYAVEHSSFLPANIDGKAVPVRYRLPIRFKLN